MLPNSYPEYLSAPVLASIRYSSGFLYLHSIGVNPKSRWLTCAVAEVAIGTSLRQS